MRFCLDSIAIKEKASAWNCFQVLTSVLDAITWWLVGKLLNIIFLQNSTPTHCQKPICRNTESIPNHPCRVRVPMPNSE